MSVFVCVFVCVFLYSYVYLCVCDVPTHLTSPHYLPLTCIIPSLTRLNPHPPPHPPPSQVENEEMITTLEALIETFSDDMAQYATQLAQHLANAFWRVQQADEENDDDDDDTAALAAYGCVRTIGTLLEAVSTLPHLYPQACCWVLGVCIYITQQTPHTQQSQSPPTQ